MIRSIAVLAGALLATVVVPPAAVASPPTTPPATAPTGHGGHGAVSATFTLLTGDVVELWVAADGTQRGEVVHDVAPRDDVSFQEIGGDLHAFTPDVARLVADDRLDRELFNLTALRAAGYDDEHLADVPVIATYRTKAALTARAPTGTRQVRALPSVGARALSVRKDQAERSWPGLTAGVAKLWLDGRVTAALDLSVPAIGADDAWRAGLDGTGVRVAVLDTGVDLTHPDLADRIAVARSFVPGADVQDGDGHGTHVASTVLGSGAASAGAYTGVAPGARLVVGKVLDDTGAGQDSEIIAGMEWAAAQGAKVINMSLGGGLSNGADPMSQAVNRISADTGALFVIAAGNNGNWRPSQISTPGAADLALTVGNVVKTAPHGSSESSSVGPRTQDYAIKPEITAPGTDIVAARSATSSRPAIPANPRYTSLTGTSMATPHVAGAAALLAQQHPDWTGARLKDALVSTATPNQDNPITWQGGGMVDLRHATTARLVSTGTLNLGAIEPPHPTTSGEVTLRNPGTEVVHADLTLDLFQADPTRHQQSPYSPMAGAVTISPSRVDLPPGATATVTVTVEFATLDTASYYGRLVATGTGGTPLSRTAVSWTKEVERHRLTVLANDRAGVPANTTAWSWVHLVNLETGDYHQGWFDRGVGVFGDLGADPLVPAGRYAVLANISEFTEGEPYSKLAETIGGDPELVLDGDRTVVIDARRGEPVRFATPRPGVPVDGPGLDLVVSRVVGEPGYEKLRLTLTFNSTEVYLLPTGTVRTGTFAARFSTRLAAEDLTMTLDRRSLGAQYPLEESWGECMAFDVVYCVPTVAAGRHRVVDAGTGTPAELAGVAGKVAFVREVEVDAIPRVAAAAAAAGATGVAYGLTDTGPAIRWVHQRATIPVAVLPKAGADRLAAALRRGPATITTGGDRPSGYVYDLEETVTGRLPAGITYRYDGDDLARVDARYHADVPGTVYREMRDNRYTPFRAPFRRTEYVSPGVAWRHWTFFPAGDRRSQERSDTTYAEGARVTERHFDVPVVPRVTKGITTVVTSYYQAVSLAATPFTTTPAMSFEYASPPPGAIAFRYLRDGELLCATSGTCRLDATEPGRYRVELDAEQWTRPLATRSSTVWEADAEFGPATEELPTMNLAYDVPVGMDNAVRAGSAYEFTVAASYVRTGPGGIRLRAWVSHDGGRRWTDLGRQAADRHGSTEFPGAHAEEGRVGGRDPGAGRGPGRQRRRPDGDRRLAGQRALSWPGGAAGAGPPNQALRCACQPSCTLVSTLARSISARTLRCTDRCPTPSRSAIAWSVRPASSMVSSVWSSWDSGEPLAAAWSSSRVSGTAWDQSRSK
ncbi:S8 family serine peptidase [Actinophytocola sediminis]